MLLIGLFFISVVLLIAGSSLRLLMIVEKLLACGKQTHFSAIVSPAEKIAIFSAGETKAEKCVCSTQAKKLSAYLAGYKLASCAFYAHFLLL